MNNRPPPYNPYAYNIPTAPYIDNRLSPYTQYVYNVATAPPMDIEYVSTPIDNIKQMPITYQQTNQNYMYSQPTYPSPIYVHPPINYKDNTERHRREEIEKITRREQDECCCVGILAILCCCFMNIEL